MVNNLVDLVTLDRELEDIMITEYPGKMFEDQHYIDTDDPDTKVYMFFDLDRATLLGFLEGYKNSFDYKVLDSETGESIVINKINVSEESQFNFPKNMTFDN